MSAMKTDKPLCERIFAESKKIHTVSNGLVQSKLLALFSDRVLYGEAISCFYFVFKALENAIEDALTTNRSDVLSGFADLLRGGLYRTPGYRRDLEYFLGSDWESQVSSPSAPSRSAAVQAYEQHLAALGRDRPHLLLAHVFTQHLAAASGGQILKRLARKHLRLPEGRGTGAFDFEGESNNTLRSQFKAKMNAWGEGLSPEQVAEVTAEHIAAFRHNNAIIAAFPIPPIAVASGLLRLLPKRPLLVVLAACALVLAGANALTLGALAGARQADGRTAASPAALMAAVVSVAPGWLLLGLLVMLVRQQA